MSEEPAFLDAEQVKILHHIALERHGGQDGIRDAAAFESAVMHIRGKSFVLDACRCFSLR